METKQRTNSRTRKPQIDEFARERYRRLRQKLADVTAKYHGDPDFKALLDADPTGTLKEEGLEIPEGKEVKLLFNTESLLHLVLPSPIDESP